MIRMIQGAIFILLLNTLFFYLGWNGWHWLRVAFNLENPWLYSTCFAILCYSYVIGRIGKGIPFFRVIGSFWFGFIQYGVILFPIANLVVFLFSFSVMSTTNVIFWTGIVVLVLFGLLFAYGIFQAYSPIIRTFQITIPKSSKRGKIRIGVASDMHFGGLSGVSHAKNLVKHMKDMDPDLILLPGDIIDDKLAPFLRKNMGAIMGELQAPLGVYGVLGNHEYYGGDIEDYMNEMKKHNIAILKDELVDIEDSILLVGRKDKTDRNRKSFQELIENVDKERIIIAMDHQPFELNQALEAGVDVLFSGHTHRGQMAPNHLITKKMYELDWGYLKKKQLHAFVSSGYGFWGPPLRIGSRSEIMQIEIEFKQTKPDSVI